MLAHYREMCWPIEEMPWPNEEMCWLIREMCWPIEEMCWLLREQNLEPSYRVSDDRRGVVFLLQYSMEFRKSVFLSGLKYVQKYNFLT